MSESHERESEDVPEVDPLDAAPEVDEPAPTWAKLLLVAFPLAVVAIFMLLEAWIRG